MIHDNIGRSLPPGQTQECLPNYEHMIKQTTERRNRNERLINAIQDYLNGSGTRGKMSELIGDLVSENWSLIAERDRLIKAQENNG